MRLIDLVKIKGSLFCLTSLLFMLPHFSSATEPVANDQHFSMRAAELLALPILLAGRDADHDPLTYSIVTPPANGIIIGSGARIEYLPTSTFRGTDTFTYKASDASDDSNIATVTIDVIQETVTSDQVSDGPVDSLFLHVPSHLVTADISTNQHVVTLTGDVMHESASSDPSVGGHPPFVSRNDLTNKTISIDLGSKSANVPLTISFKCMPTSATQNEIVMQSNAFKIEDDAGGITSTYFDQSGGQTTVSNTSSTLKPRSSNHVAVVMGDSLHSTYLNGYLTEESTNTSNLRDIDGTIVIGPYPGKVWDIRIYERRLTPSEIADLGGNESSDERLLTSPDPDYPNYLVGVYVNEWWPDHATETLEELQYYLHAQDAVYERNLFEGGMYPRNELGAYFASESCRTLILSDGIRNTFVWPTFADPLTQENGYYWLHENFHAYQGRLKDYTGRGMSKFMLESGATWGAIQNIPAVKDTLLGYYTLQPHLPLWTDQNSPVDMRHGWEFKGGHQYGANIFWGYFSAHVANKRWMGDVHQTIGHPQAAYDLLAIQGHDMAPLFGEFAARITTWDILDGSEYQASENASLTRMSNAKPNAGTYNNKVTTTYDSFGTYDMWTPVPEPYIPGAWAWNAYKIENITESTTYIAGLKTDLGNPANAAFQAQVVVHNTTTQERVYHILDVASPGVSSEISFPASAGDEIYLIVATTPNVFSGYENWYEYEYKLHPDPEDNMAPSPNPMTWASPPAPSGDQSIIMTATTATDASGVEYYFSCTAGGGNDSGWQNSATYEDTGLDPNTLYTYSVKVRDKSRNANLTGSSTSESATTNPIDDDNVLNVYLLIGQSNMEGQAYTYDSVETSNWNIPTLEFLLSGSTAATNYLANMPFEFKGSLTANWLLPRDDAWAVHYDSGDGSLKDVLPSNDPADILSGIQSLRPGFGVATSVGSMFGVELGMGTRLGESIQSPVFLFKSSRGGTTLGNDWRPPNAVTQRGGAVGSEYVNTMTRFIELLDTLDADLADDNQLNSYDNASNYVVAGVFWLQGWNEKFGDSPYSAEELQAEYADNLKDLIHSIREADPRIPFDVPLIIAESSDQNLVLNAARQEAVDQLNEEIPVSAAYFDTDNMIGVDWGDNDSGAPFTQSFGFHYHSRAENFLEIGWKAAGAILDQGFYIHDTSGDFDAPSPSTLSWATAPIASGSRSITMTATTATDINGVEYYFTCTNGNGNDSGWQNDPVYEDTGLLPGTTYTYTVIARDRSSQANTTAASTSESATTNPLDIAAPSPAVASFSSVPTALNSTEVTMTATIGNDASGPVEYFFNETSGALGGSDSGWTTNPVYTDTGLNPNIEYTYTVQMRDAEFNIGVASAPESVTTPLFNAVLKAYYDFEPSDPLADQAGTFSDDLIGYNAAWSTNTPHASSTQSASFDGDAALFTDAYTSDLGPGSTAYTIMFWVRARDEEQENTVTRLITTFYLPNGSDASDPAWQIQGFGNSGTAGGEMDLRSNSGSALLFSADARNGDIGAIANIGQETVWHHVAFVVANSGHPSNAGAYAETYLDGVSVGIVNLDASWDGLDIANPDGQLIIGSTSETGDKRDFTGLLDDLALFSGVVSAEDIATIANGELSPASFIPDVTPPTPNPSSFSSPPAAVSDTKLTMTATTATDENGVEYYFTCIDGNADDSGWQDSPTYEPTGLLPDTTYTYTVMSRDKSKNQNTTTNSSEESATTQSPDIIAPTPNPSLFLNPPLGISTTEITMTATSAVDINGVEYYFTCLTGGGNDSGWQDSPIYTDSGLTPDTAYSYTTRSRDKSTQLNTTDPSASLSATTLPTDITPPTPGTASFSMLPTTVGRTQITMRATIGADRSGPVEYYFDEVSGNPGGSDSGWTTNPVFTDTQLKSDTQYTYTVQLRDALLNTGTVSAQASATTPEYDGILTTYYDFEPANPFADLAGDFADNLTGFNAEWSADTPLSSSAQSASFNGNTALFTGAYSTDLGPGIDAYTIMFWIYGRDEDQENTNTRIITTKQLPTGPASSRPSWQIAGVGNNGSNGDLMGLRTSNGLSLIFSEDAVSDANGALANTGQETVWRHVAFVVSNSGHPDNAGAYMETYLDGVSVGVVNPDDSWDGISIGNVDGQLIIGSTTKTGTSRDFTGLMDDVALFSGVVSAEDIAAIANGILSPTSFIADTTPPIPNASTFASIPTAISGTEITMTATTASDPAGPVEYYFEETSGNPGGSDSGWSTSAVYTDTGLDPNTQYTYTVQTRDILLNTGTASSAVSVTTDSMSGYQIWATANGVGTEDGDDDNDGRSNFYEYALDGDPSNAQHTGSPPRLVYQDGALNYIHLQRNDDASLVYLIEVKTKLSNEVWSPVVYPILERNVIGGAYDEIISDVPTDEPNLFIRLKVRDP